MRTRARWIYAAAAASLAVGLLAAFLALRGLRVRGALSLHDMAAELATDYFTYGVWLAGSAALLVALGLLLAVREQQLWESAVTDPITHLGNRRHFEERMTQVLHQVAHRRTTLALLIVDVDGLKSINDRLGHEAGDLAIQMVAEALRRTCRSLDFTARWGGDEFVIVAPSTAAAPAAVLGDRVRATLRQLAQLNDRVPPSLSVSIGVAAFEQAEPSDARTLFAAADRALYIAKRQGGDRVQVANRSSARASRSLWLVPNEEEHHANAESHPGAR